jgi:tRNA (guanine-N7-)-methyltransferase
MTAADLAAPEGRGRRSPYFDAPRLPPGEALGAAQILSRVLDPAGVGSDVAPDAASRGVELEIGPGRGGFLLERLAAAPEVNIIALEIRLKWASLLDESVRERGYGERARVFAEDIRLALPRLAPGTLSRVFIHFPDPWWKKRHAKRRLASADVMQQLARLLRPGGELFIQTDVWETASGYREAVEALGAFAPDGDDEGSPLLAENPYGARSPRERRVLADGLPVIRLRYRRAAPSVDS